MTVYVIEKLDREAKRYRPYATVFARKADHPHGERTQAQAKARANELTEQWNGQGRNAYRVGSYTK